MIPAVLWSELERAGSRLPNSWGLYDTMGNVREACLDWMQTSVVWNTNGVPNANGDYLADGVTVGSTRVIRGGYYKSGWKDTRPSNREASQAPNNWVDGFGLRLVTSFGLE